MKKVYSILAALSLGLGLCACSPSLSAQSPNTAQAQAEADCILLHIVNGTDENWDSIGMSYYINGEVVSSGGGCNADGSAIKPGDDFTFNIIAEDLGDAAEDPEQQVLLQLTAYTDQGETDYIPVEGVSFPVLYGKTYTIQLEGHLNGDLTLSTEGGAEVVDFDEALAAE